MSSDKEGEKPSRRKSQGFLRKANPRRVSRAPKVRAKAVADGNLVNSPGPAGCDGRR